MQDGNAMQNQVKLISSRLGVMTAVILAMVLLMEYAAQISMDVFSFRQALLALLLYATLLYVVDTVVFASWCVIRREELPELYVSLVIPFSVLVIGGNYINKRLIPWRLTEPPSIALNLIFAAACCLLGYMIFRSVRRGKLQAIGATKGAALSVFFFGLRGAAVIVVLLALLFSGEKTVSSKGERHGKPLNVFVLLIDTLRPDHLTCYGYERPTSPNICALASDGTLFRNAYAHANWTVTSVATLLTGVHPAVHQVFGTENRLPQQAETVAEILKENGWKTGFFTGLQVIGSEIGFCQGADKVYPPPLTEPGWFIGGNTAFEQAWRRLLPLTKGVTRSSYTAGELVGSALGWFEQIDSEPIFAYLHFNEPHWPYTPPAPYNSLFSEKPLEGRTDIKEAQQTVEMLRDSIDLYDGEIVHVDAEIGKFFDSLKKGDLYDDSLIILLADHGEEFHEHGGWGHGRTMYEETIHVPLIIKPPAGAARVKETEHLCGLIDVLPTILDYAGIQTTGTAGRSLRPAIEGRPIEPVGIISSASDSSTTYPYLNALRTPEYTLIGDMRDSAPAVELYLREADRNETENVAVEKPDEAKRLQEELNVNLSDAISNSFEKDIYDVSEERMRVLKDLGYLQ